MRLPGNVSASNSQPTAAAAAAGPQKHASPFRVRFRSRVRVGSGLRHHSNRCSVDSSPSSSYSAPLRYHHDESDVEPATAIVTAATTTPTPTRGSSKSKSKSKSAPSSTLALALAGADADDMMGFGFSGIERRSDSSSSTRKDSRRRPKGVRHSKPNGNIGRSVHVETGTATERTALLKPGATPNGATYTSGVAEYHEDGEGAERTHARMLRQTSDGEAFGQWPWRLFNGYVSAMVLHTILTSR